MNDKVQIKLLCSLATSEAAYNYGDCVYWDAIEAKRFVDNGSAEYVELPTKKGKVK